MEPPRGLGLKIDIQNFFVALAYGIFYFFFDQIDFPSAVDIQRLYNGLASVFEIQDKLIVRPLKTHEETFIRLNFLIFPAWTYPRKMIVFYVFTFFDFHPTLIIPQPLAQWKNFGLLRKFDFFSRKNPSEVSLPGLTY